MAAASRPGFALGSARPLLVANNLPDRNARTRRRRCRSCAEYPDAAMVELRLLDRAKLECPDLVDQHHS